MQKHYSESLLDVDPELASALDGELNRQRTQIELIASENLVSRAVLQAQGSIFTNKTVEGYPGNRYYGGAEYADVVESLAIKRACDLFKCSYANVQAHSGSNANQAVYLGCLMPGDSILSMDINAGGHISHGHSATITGRFYTIHSYGVCRDSELIDYDGIEKLAAKHKPRMVIAGGSAYSRIIDFERLSSIAKKAAALLLVDMAHFAGLVATGFYPNPFPHADIVTTTTYKSLRGARGGLILWNDEKLCKKLNNGLFPGVQGSVLLHGVAGKAVCLHEASQSEFIEYNRAVIDNAQILAESLSQSGIRIVSDGTDTGLMLVDLQSLAVTGSTAVDSLERAGLTCNKNVIPFDARPPEIASGLRLSVNAGTARGFRASEFKLVGQWISTILSMLANNDPSPRVAPSRMESSVRYDVEELCQQFPIYT